MGKFGKLDCAGRLAPWLLIAAGLIAYANSLAAPFIFDDLGAIVDNPDIRQLWPVWREADSSARPSLNSRPVVLFSLALNYAVDGLEVRGYHAVNIGLHILCGLVLYGIVRRTLRSPQTGDRFQGAADVLGLSCALLWLVHPLHTQTVNYIVQRSESIMGLCYLLTLYCVIRGLAPDNLRRWRVGAVIVCGLGMASKEVMVTAPLLVLLYDRAFWAASWAQLWGRRWGLYTGLAATWGVLAALMWSRPHGDSVGFSAGVGPLDYALNQTVAVVGYLQKAFWPDPLVLDYGFVAPLSLSAAWPYAAALSALLLVAAATVWRWPRLGFPGVWFFVTLAPTSSLVPIVNEVGAERRAYLALAGLIALVVVGAHLALAWRCRRRAAAAAPLAHPVSLALVVVVLAVALAAGTISRNREHASSERLWRTVVDAVPQNPRGHLYLGLALDDRGDPQAALEHYRRAVQIKPDYAEAHNNLGMALGRQERVEEAIHHFRQALRLRPDLPQAHNNLGTALVGVGLPGKAADHFLRALQLKPEYADAHNNLGTALARQGHVDQAVHHFRQALRIRPDFAAARRNLDIALSGGEGRPRPR